MVIGVKELGYPEYFLTIDGAAKLLAILGLLIPNISTVREWTSAGLTFLASGAAWSHLANNQSPLAPSVFMALTLTSYGLWLKTPDILLAENEPSRLDESISLAEAPPVLL